MSHTWWFHETDEYLGLSAPAYRNIYASAGLIQCDRFVREVIQNSVDAYDKKNADGQPVRVTFEKRTLVGESKTSFVEALNLGGEIHARRGQFKQDPDVSKELLGFYEHIGDSAEPLSIMIVSDYNTVGLGGRWNRQGKGDHFGRLVMGFGVGDKAEGSDFSGGSFGFGKTIYAASTKSGLVAFYSVFAPNDETDGAHARFMATGVLARHTFKGKQFSGFSFLGDQSGGKKPSPLTDDAADAMAETCGLAKRSPKQLGSTIVLIGCDFSAADIIEAAEVHWWPRLLSHSLEIEVIDGEDVKTPRPKTNAKIAPFVRCWMALQHNSADASMFEAKLQAFENSYGDMAHKKVGRLMFTVAGDSEKAAWGEEQGDHLPSRDRVALIRSTRMVISYYKASDQGALAPIAGVFVADEDSTLDKILTYSEPPQHNSWDDKSDRFKSHFTIVGPRVVKSILSRIKNAARRYQDSLEPPKPKDASASKALGKILGRFFRAPGPKPPPPPPGEKRLVEMHLDAERTLQGKVLMDVSKIRLAIKRDAEVDTMTCKVTVANDLLGDDTLALLDRQDLQLFDSTGKKIAEGKDVSVVLELTADKFTTLTARAPITGRAVTRTRVMVEELGADA